MERWCSSVLIRLEELKHGLARANFKLVVASSIYGSQRIRLSV